MSLENTLIDITARLRQNRFINEQAISQGVVLRVLQELGWDTWETTVVWPEYQTGEGRADFALCHPHSKPLVFIEVKQPGKAEDAVRQALKYAFDTGVQFVVLTDGRTWSFYLPAEQGTHEERRVYKLDLFERPAAEAAEAFSRYLARSRTESGEARETALREYRSRNRRSQARAAIPDAWRDLVEKGDDLLVELVATAVESKAGVRPENDDVAELLAALDKHVVKDVPPTNVTPGKGRGPKLPPPDGESSRTGQLILRDRAYQYNNANRAMVIVRSELVKTDSSFLERCSRHPGFQGRTRRYIARTPQELYPDRPDLRECRSALPGGWLIATNISNREKEKIIRLATEVAGLTYGKDVIVEL
jgi:hypothetical protein